MPTKEELKKTIDKLQSNNADLQLDKKLKDLEEKIKTET